MRLSFKYNHNVDIWSYGVTLYYLFTLGKLLILDIEGVKKGEELTNILQE